MFTITVNGKEMVTVSGCEGAYHIFTEMSDLLEGIATVELVDAETGAVLQW